jgi:hypothetical protein
MICTDSQTYKVRYNVFPVWQQQTFYKFTVCVYVQVKGQSMIILQKSLKNTANFIVINADMFLTYFLIMDHG